MKKIILIFLILSNSVVYAGVSNEVKNLQTQWAKIKYNTPEKEQEKKFEQLLAKAEKLVIKHPGDVDTLIWEGIIRSTYAGAKG